MPPTSPIQTLRARHIAFLLPYPLDTITDTALLLSTLKQDGSWPDLNYADTSLSKWQPAQHIYRLANIAITNPTHPAILPALDFWYAHNFHCPNWWWNQIGVPAALADTLLCLPTDTPPSYIDRAIPAFEAHLHSGIEFNGQNLIWVAFIQLRHGILTTNEKRISHATKQIASEVRIFPHEEGIQPDLSFHQHGKLLYSGGYGQNFAQDIAQLIALTAGTPFAFPPHTSHLFLRFLDASRWMVCNNTFDPAATGREITRQGLNATRFQNALRSLSSTLDERPETRDAQLSPPLGNRHFWSSDFMTHRRLGFYISIRTTSSRILRCDDAHGGGEGRTLHHMADGFTHFMRDGREYYDIYPVWNYRQLPGITALQHSGEFDRKTLVTKGETAFSGGASDGTLGCIAMDFARDNLRARKAWFLFDDGLVALAAGITASSPHPVRTTLNQCLWRAPVYLDQSTLPLSQGAHTISPGHAFHHDGFTYHLIDGQAALTLGPQSGAWSECGVGSPDRVTLSILNAGIDHGIRPTNATCAYAILSHSSPSDPGPAPLILSNTPKLQAVWHTREKRGHAVFYEFGLITFPDGQSFRVDQPCIILYHPLPDDKIALTIADPTQTLHSITLTLRGPITAALTFPLPTQEYAGSSQTITFGNN